jgi:hypothetical protein
MTPGVLLELQEIGNIAEVHSISVSKLATGLGICNGAEK